MNKLIILLLVGLSYGAYAQEYRQTETGLEFKFYHDEQGVTAKLGDFLSLHMIIKGENGYEVKNSYKEKGGKQILFPVKVSAHEADLYEAVKMLSIGDSATFRISTDSMYAKIFKKPIPSGLSAGSKLLVNVKCFSITTQQAHYDKLVEKNKQETVKRKTEIIVNKKRESEEIESYFKRNEFIANKTASGIYYMHKKIGKGRLVQKGNSLLVDFEMKRLDGFVLESSYKDSEKPFFTVGNGEIIPGLEEAILLMRDGGYSLIVIPSYLAYGFKGKGEKIPPYTPIVFELGILSVR